MKLAASIATLILVGSAFAQVPAAPAEMAKLGFMVGSWTNTGSASGPDGSKETSKGSGMAAMVHDGMWLKFDVKETMEKSGKMDGHMMLGWDAAKGMYRGAWFDNMSSSLMTFQGKMEGNKLVMTSDPVNHMGMDMKFRLTYEAKAANELMFTLDMDMEGKWVPAMTITYKK